MSSVIVLCMPDVISETSRNNKGFGLLANYIIIDFERENAGRLAERMRGA